MEEKLNLIELFYFPAHLGSKGAERWVAGYEATQCHQSTLEGTTVVFAPGWESQDIHESLSSFCRAQQLLDFYMG